MDLKSVLLLGVCGSLIIAGILIFVAMHLHRRIAPQRSETIYGYPPNWNNHEN